MNNDSIPSAASSLPSEGERVLAMYKRLHREKLEREVEHLIQLMDETGVSVRVARATYDAALREDTPEKVERGLRAALAVLRASADL